MRDAQVTAYALVAVTLAHLAAILTRRNNAPSVAAVTLSIVAAAGTVLLSSVCHKRALKSSSLLVLYLLVGGCWNLSAVPKLAAADQIKYQECFAPAVGVIQLVLLFLECTSKQDVFLPQYKSLAPVETANLFSAVSFWWINRLLAQGNKQIFQDEDIPPLDSCLRAASLNKTIKDAWRTRGSSPLRLTMYSGFANFHSETGDKMDVVQSFIQDTYAAVYYYHDPQDFSGPF